MEAEQQKRLQELMAKDRSERIGTQRAELLDTINNGGDPYKIGEAFKEMSEFEKSLGLLYGKLMQAPGNAQVDRSIAWYEEEYGGLIAQNGGADGRFTDLQKNLILVYVIQQIVGASAEGYRVLRQILVKLNQNGK
jgi:hypothetical protein